MEPTPTSHSSPEGAAPASPLPPVADCDCRAVLSLLERCEADPAFGRRDARTLVAHLERCAPCAQRHGRRLSGAIGFVSLHERRVPSGLLDDLYATVHARAPYAPLAGGMSAAFLDGPRSLRLWRSAAVAAVLVLGVGATWVLSNGGLGAGRSPNPVPLRDVRNDYLGAADVHADEDVDDPRFSTVSWPQHVRWPPYFERLLRPAPGASETKTEPRRN
jgi:hypothetical protein